MRDEFGKGLAAYRAWEWDAPARQFRRCLELRPRTIRLLRMSSASRPSERIHRPQNWDGVWHLTKQ